jgi:DNA-binding protein HU-beta
MAGIKECAKAYAKEFGTSKVKAEVIMKNAVSVIVDQILTTGEVKFIGDFTIKQVTRKARVGRNPKTKQEYEIPETTTLKIKVGDPLKEMLNS